MARRYAFSLAKSTTGGTDVEATSITSAETSEIEAKSVEESSICARSWDDNAVRRYAGEKTHATPKYTTDYL